MEDYPFVSVIIPVFHDGERFKRCLAALAQQTYARSRYEVIVVDNDSDHWQALLSILLNLVGFAIAFRWGIIAISIAYVIRRYIVFLIG